MIQHREFSGNDSEKIWLWFNLVQRCDACRVKLTATTFVIAGHMKIEINLVIDFVHRWENYFLHTKKCRINYAANVLLNASHM